MASDEPKSGAVDQEAFQRVIRDNLSPEAVATIIAYLQPAAFQRGKTEEQRRALREVEWFANTLTDLIGAEECSRLFEDMGL